MTTLALIKGSHSQTASGKKSTACREASVLKAIIRGYTVGKRLLIGNVEGTVIGYNIADDGDYPGTIYPLVVDTRYGITKCALIEVGLGVR
ncbi:MAG: hypothetical protein WC100_05030 [Sterolibacterium sp.]